MKKEKNKSTLMMNYLKNRSISFIKSSLLVCVFIILNNNLLAQEIKYDTIPKYSFMTIQEFWEQMDDIFSDPNFNSAHWGVVIQSLNTGEYFYKRNENKLFMPASNLKLFTTSSGLLSLGAKYKYPTEIYMSGKTDGSIINGNLIIKGYGDPAISGRFFNDNMFQVFEDWADSLLDLGFDEITGNIIGDDNAFDDKGLGSGWSWDYESDWFAAPSGALSFNDNCVDINIIPSEKGKQAKVTITPSTKYTVIIDNVLTVPKDSSSYIDVYRERGTNIIKISGTIKEDSPIQKQWVTVSNPTQYFVVVFKEILQKKGIKVKGYPIDVDDLSEDIDYEKCDLLFTHYSPTLEQLIRVINKSSQNFFAEQLLKTLGYKERGLGTDGNGIRVEKRIVENMGINTDGLQIVDGSGLSRMNMVSPSHIANLLSYMSKDESFEFFYKSLPIAGVDGTIANRMKKARTQNNVRAKTGYIGGARSLSGYVYTGDKELIAFSMMVNNFTVPSVLADAIQDLVCLRLANFKRK